MEPERTHVGSSVSLKPKPPWRLGIDVGGTFTDLVLMGCNGGMLALKVPSTPADPGAGVTAAIERASATLSIEVAETLAACTHFVHGSTVATNTLLEAAGARVGLLTTAGFRDTLEIRRGIRLNQWDHRRPHPSVLVPRRLRLPVRGRIDRSGKEIERLEVADIEAALRDFAKLDVDAIAICLINSYANPAHEERCLAHVRSVWKGEWAFASSNIFPIPGEYERCSTTVLCAYIAPRLVPYLRALEMRLRDAGLVQPLLLAQSNGGTCSVDEVAKRPASLLLSGPAAVRGALRFFANAADGRDLISMEVGGTSCDVAVTKEGVVPVSDELIIAGYHASIPSVDIHTVGTGGGTIAWADTGGLLRVGPRGAGAMPGPAAYGNGGQSPTLTDALIVLGRLHPGPLAGGSVVLDAEPAHQVIGSLATLLGLDVERTAVGILTLAEQAMIQALEELAARGGIDLREYTLLAAGGAGPMHASAVARALGCRHVFIPRLAGAFCALGLACADMQLDQSRSFRRALANVDSLDLDQVFQPLEVEARARLGGQDVSGRFMLDRFAEMRYHGQHSPLRIPLDVDFSPTRLLQQFERQHQALFGHVQPGAKLEFVALHSSGTIRFPEPVRPLIDPAGASAPQLANIRKMYVDATRGVKPVSVVDGRSLQPGSRFRGPALIEEETTTTFVGFGEVLSVDKFGDIHLLIEQGADAGFRGEASLRDGSLNG